MKKESLKTPYVAPEVEIVLFESSDIVTASGSGMNGTQDPYWDDSDNW